MKAETIGDDPAALLHVIHDHVSRGKHGVGDGDVIRRLPVHHLHSAFRHQRGGRKDGVVDVLHAVVGVDVEDEVATHGGRDGGGGEVEILVGVRILLDRRDGLRLALIVVVIRADGEGLCARRFGDFEACHAVLADRTLVALAVDFGRDAPVARQPIRPVAQIRHHLKRVK